MQPDSVHSQVLREMANVIARPLSIMKDHDDQGRLLSTETEQTSHLSSRMSRRIQGTTGQNFSHGEGERTNSPRGLLHTNEGQKGDLE